MIDRDVFEFYDQGWNAYMRGEPYNPNATSDWRVGWRDCRDAVDLGVRVPLPVHRMRTYGYTLGSVRAAPNGQQQNSNNVKVTYKFRADKPKEIK